jgi:chemotaxis protein CheX
LEKERRVDITLKAEHVNPFIQATVQTFASMVKMKVEPGRIRIKDSGCGPYDVSGVIGLTGGAKGSVSLSFPRATARGVVAAFTGGADVTTNQISDAVGELANIVAGAAKHDLAHYKLAISLPTVIQGAGHAVAGPADSVALVIPFTCPAGGFDLSVSFKSLI